MELLESANQQKAGEGGLELIVAVFNLGFGMGGGGIYEWSCEENAGLNNACANVYLHYLERMSINSFTFKL